MKIKFLGFFLFFTFLLSSISALDIQVKDEFLHNENFVAKVNVNFYLPLAKSNVYFYRRHLPTSMANYNVIEAGGSYYVTADIPLEKINDNYSIVIKNALYLIGGQLHTEDLIGNFSIVEGEVSYSISPNLEIGEKDYSFSLTNLGSESLDIDYNNAEGISGSISLGPFATENVFFVAESIGLKTVNFNYNGESYDSSYYVSRVEETIVEIDTCTPAGYSCLSFCNGTLFSGYECLGESICCLVDTTPEEINETVEENVTIKENITQEENFTIPENVSIEENETIDENKSFWDIVRDLFKDEKVSEQVEENVSEESAPEGVPSEEDNETEEEGGFFDSLFGGDDEDEGDSSAIETCEELGFAICGESEICDGDTEYGKDGLCCKGNCEIEEESSSGQVLGWAIIAVIILSLTWFFKKKFKGTKRSKINLLKRR